jgi:probable F420-dependent oxidoreductase
MREYVLAMRAIWACWNDDVALNFRGEFYRHTLMSPFFNPGPNPYGAPQVYLAAVGELMTEVAGEVADGLLVHPFTTERYIREVTLPALERGLAKSGREPGDFPISFSGLIATGGTDEELADATRRVKGQIAFYGSTPAYRGVLELHGWGDLQTELNTLSKTGEWEKMGELIDDDVLNAFSIVARPDEVGTVLRSRLNDVISRFSIYAPYALSDDTRRAIVGGLRS